MLMSLCGSLDREYLRESFICAQWIISANREVFANEVETLS